AACHLGELFRERAPCPDTEAEGIGRTRRAAGVRRATGTETLHRPARAESLERSANQAEGAQVKTAGVVLAALSLLLSVGCAEAPRPRVLGAVDATRKSPALEASRPGAPQAFARAEGFRRQAEAAHDNEEPAKAQILGEQALAAYQRTVTLDRLRRAELRSAQAEAALATREKEIAAEEARERTLDAEARAVELRLKVAREALPLPTSGPSSPEREKARLNAARALATQARLLCAAARLLDAKRAELNAAFQRLDELDKKVASGDKGSIDLARSERSACLRELTATRRPTTQKNPASAATDQLLARLSDASLEPSRDDRGVVVTLEKPFGKDDQLKGDVKTRLTELASVAKANPAFPVQVVVHSGTKIAPARETLRADRAASALREGGAPSVEAHAVGTALPGLDPGRSGGPERNERVDVVFVAPSAS
ncbi:MAG TPA: hypothetical protein VF103_09815, partial [Polyangiaceae bacterium]